MRAIALVFWLCFAFAAQAAIITNVEPTSLSDDTFIITWSTTDETASTEILWGVGGLTNVATVAGTTKFHYLKLTGLSQNTTYQYRVRSGATLFPSNSLPVSTFTTLAKPSGEHLFDFAVMNDLRYAETPKADSSNARGIPYTKGAAIISSEVADINGNVAFTVINGNLADSSVTYNTQLKTNLKNILENLRGASDLPFAAYKYMATPGFHDKQATYTTAADDWLSDNMLPLNTSVGTTESRYASLYGYNATSKDADSVFNYQFAYNHYNFIFLDSVKDNSNGSTGNANLPILHNLLSAESNTKTFIFMAYPAYNAFGPTYKDYPISLPSSEVGGALAISNDSDFRSTIEAFKDGSGNPIVAAVVSSHLGDNYLRTIEAISYVRQGPAIQYPTGYSIYKVYTNGYIKSFYKTTGRDGTDKPYYEYARDQIADESGVPAAVFTQFWLGSNSQRNFTFTYPFIPGVSPTVLSTSPASNESAVSLNRPINITFNKRMLSQNVNNWVTVSPSVGTISAHFLDAANTILSVSHSTNFDSGKTYTATVVGSLASDEGSTTMEANYVFSFNTTGGSVDSTPPVSAVTSLPSNSTTDPFPTFTGVASDDSGVLNVEYRLDSTGAWVSAEAVDGVFNSTTEAFRIHISSAVSPGSHSLWLRTTDGASNVSAEGVSAYSFTLTENKPNITIKVGGNKLFNGDTIASTPKFQLIITSANGLPSGSIRVDNSTTAFASMTVVNVDTTYYATLEVTTALSDGRHGLTVEAFDSLGNGTTAEVFPLYVQSAAAVALQGTPLNYPNPYDPAGGATTTIGYTLSKPSSITLTIHDLSGNMLVRKTFSSAENGGQAGYNTVTWNGKSDAGDYVGNGIYIYIIVADGRVLAKGKLTVIKR